MEDTAASDQEKQCSNCKRFISANAFLLHEAHCRRHLRLCEVCQEPVPLQDMEEHHRENHAPQSCDHCGATMPADRLEEHLESQCPEREVNCKYCELEVRAGDYDSHIETCGSRTDYCDRCNVRVMLKDMEEHKLAKCSDLKVGDGLHPEPTLENLPPAYMDGFAGDGFSTGASSQGVLMGDGAEGAFGGIRILGGFGMAPQFLEDGAILFGGHPPSRDNGQRWRREVNVELDQEWLQEVGGVCEGEDLDRMMAQAIAMETNKQATSNDHLFGIDDRLLREDHYANVVRDMEDERATNDEEMARRLQNTFDDEYNLERADENLARQLRREEETVSIPDSPPLTSVLPTGTNTPISAHHPQAPLTSHLPTVDYQTSIQRTRFSVPEGREKDNDNDDKEEWRREGERLREEEREKEREQLRERLREEEREGENLRKRLRKEEREREQLIQRLRKQVREGEGDSDERKLLTGRLDGRDRMASEVKRDMWRVRQNGDEATGAEYDHGEDAPEKIDDAELAYELQKKEIEDARIAANEEMRAEIEKKQMEMKSAELIIQMGKEDIEYNRKKLAEHKAKIDSLTRQIQKLPEKKKERGRYWSETGVTPGKWDADYYPRHEYDESHFDEPPPTPPNSPPASPSPPQSPVPMSSSAASYVRLERNDDEDEPRPKPIPKPRPQDREKIPCQFCQKSFPLDVIMSHQHHCRAGSVHGRTREVGRGRVGGVGRGAARGRAVKLNLEEVLREEQSYTREKSAVGEGNAVCKYCNEVYPQTFIDPHQVLCDKNPEKSLKNAYKSHVTAQDSSNLSALPPSSRAPSGPQPPSLSSHPEPTRDTTATVEEGLPCEFCQKSCPPHKLLSHEAVCPKRPRSRRKDGTRVAPSTAAGGGSVEIAPCQFCDRPIPLATLIRHETLCQFQREPSLPSPVSPSAILSSSQTHPTTTAHLPQTPDTHPSPSSGQGNTAAVSSCRTPPFTTATITSQTSGLTDDEKASLRHPHNPPTSSSLSFPSQPAPQQMTSGILPTPTVYSRPITTSQVTDSAPNRVTSVSSAHPTSLKSMGEALKSHPSSRTRGAYFGGTTRAQLPTTLPQIFMYNSASQPHSIRASRAAGGGVSERERKPLVSRGGSRGGDVKVTENTFEVVGNSVTPQHRDVATTASSTAVPTTSGHSEAPTRSFTAVPTTGGHTASATRSSLTDNDTARSSHSRTDPQTSQSTSVPHTATATQTSSSPLTSSTTTHPPNITTSSSTSRVPPTGGPNYTHYQRSHVPLPSTSEPSLFIGTDSTIVRPTRSDFAALRRQHPGLAPTPIPMTTSLATNPLKILANDTVATEISLLGNLRVIPPISTGPDSKKDLVKPSENKTFYNNTRGNTSENTQLLVNADKGGVKIMTGSLIQRPMIGLDMEPGPFHLHNSHRVVPLTRNSLGDTYKGNLDTMSGRNQKLDRIGMEVVLTYPQDSHNLTLNVPTDTGKSLGTMTHGGRNEKLVSMSGIGVGMVSKQQQNLRNTLLDTNKPGIAMEPGLLSEKMSLDLSSEMSLVPMQEVLNARNITGVKDASSLKEMGLTKSPLEAKTIKLDKLSKGKDKGALDAIKIMGDPVVTSNISPEYADSKSLGVSPVVGGNTVFAPSPVSNPPPFPVSSSTDNISPSSSLNSNLHFPPASVHSPNDTSPMSSIGSSAGYPPNLPPAATPSPTSPANTPHFPASSTATDTTAGSETKSNLSTSVSHSGREEDGESTSGPEIGMESSSTLTSTGGPLVEYIDSFTYVDNQQQTTSLSSTGAVGEGEEEGNEDDEEDDVEMPELEEMPEDEMESHNINTTDSDRLYPAVNPTDTTAPELPQQPFTNPPSQSTLHQLHQAPRGGGDSNKTHSSSESTASRRGGSWRKTPPPSNSNHTPRSPTARDMVKVHSSTSKPSKRTGKEHQLKGTGSDGTLHKRGHSVSGGQNGRQEPTLHTATARSPTASGSTARQTRPHQTGASSRGGKQQGAPPNSKHGFTKSAPPPTKPSRATEDPRRKASPGPQSATVHGK